MTKLGHSIAAGPAESVRAAVLNLSERSGWVVVRYQAYMEWAYDLVARDARPWLVLDPLFAPNGLENRLYPLRVTRQAASSGGALVLSGECAWQRRGMDCDVGVIDDACASGRTLVTTARAVRERGGRVARVVVCASSRAGRESYSRAEGVTNWADYLVGDWMIAHLRDGCPHVPFSGRLTPVPPLSGPGGTVEYRLPATVLPGNLWSVLWTDAAVRDAIISARREVAVRLTEAIGRQALVSDLALLGPAVPALVHSTHDVPSGDATLQSLLRSV